MKALLIVLALLFLVSCSMSEDGKHNTLMDNVQSSVELPYGAATIDSYNRYYANSPNGDVFALFVHRVTFGNPANKREWIGDYEGLQFVHDGGCDVIHVEYNVRTKESKSWCNGIG